MAFEQKEVPKSKIHT